MAQKLKGTLTYIVKVPLNLFLLFEHENISSSSMTLGRAVSLICVDVNVRWTMEVHKKNWILSSVCPVWVF